MDGWAEKQDGQETESFPALVWGNPNGILSFSPALLVTSYAGCPGGRPCPLFYLDGIPAFFQAEFAFLLLARGGAGTHGEDAAIHAHVADLHFVRDAAEGDDGPVLKFKRRDG
jgi:hypothetical protein